MMPGAGQTNPGYLGRFAQFLPHTFHLFPPAGTRECPMEVALPQTCPNIQNWVVFPQADTIPPCHDSRAAQTLLFSRIPRELLQDLGVLLSFRNGSRNDTQTSDLQMGERNDLYFSPPLYRQFPERNTTGHSEQHPLIIFPK